VLLILKDHELLLYLTSGYSKLYVGGRVNVKKRGRGEEEKRRRGEDTSNESKCSAGAARTALRLV